MHHEELESHDIVVNRFSEESVKDFRKKVNRLSVDPSMPIIVYIDSYGGNVDSLNSMLSIMKSVPNIFVTVCQGKAMSAGAALLAAGDIRFSDADSRIMIHEASGGVVGSVDDVKTDAKEFDRLNLQLMTMIANKCGKTYTELKTLIRDNEGRDLYLTAEQAKDIGLIDFVGLPQVKSTLTYSVECVPTKKRVQIKNEVDPKPTIKKKIKTDLKKKKIKK
jgi:ATP-dependent Clp endopeptidase proteolytic subunit ClpP